MAYETILTEVSDQILTVTLNRPDRLNAFTLVMQRELIEAFDRADADDEVRAIIVTGAGRAFCAGADLSGGGATSTRSPAANRRRPRPGGTARRTSPAPACATAADRSASESSRR